MIQTFKISNRVNLHYIRQTKFKTVGFGVYLYRKMDNDENVSKTALTPYVLRRGCEEYKTSREISSELEELFGANFNVGITKKGESQLIRFGMKTIADKYTPNQENLSIKAIRLLMNIIFNPVTENQAFLDEYVSQEKVGLKDAIKSIINDKKEYAMARCVEEMCKGEAFAMCEYGSLDEVDKIDAHGLYEFYCQLVATSPMDIFVCGEVDIAGIKQELVELFDTADRHDYPTTCVSRKVLETKDITEKMDINQGKLCLGFRTNILANSEEYFALVVANTIFGGGPSSKLFNNVREKMSLCYYVFSRIESLKGIMMVSCGVESENFQKAYDEIFVQFEDVKKGNFTDQEFSSSVLAIKNQINSMGDSPRQIQDFFVSNLLSGANRTVEEYLAAINSVTHEDVVRVFNKIEFDTVYRLKGEKEEEVDGNN